MQEDIEDAFVRHCKSNPMKESLTKKLMESYPDYHEQPLSLSIAEIVDPRSVLSHFFTCYDLPDMRACLKDLLHDAIRAENADGSSHVLLHQDLEKLVEASWLIYHQNENGPGIKSTIPKSRQEFHFESSSNNLDLKYGPIHEFFECFTLPFARHYLISAIKAAESSQIWSKRAPTDLLHYFEMLEKLALSLYTIIKTDNKSKKVILPKTNSSPDLTQYHLFCGRYDKLEAWDFFPRCLSVKEYRDPYRVLEKFTQSNSKKEWQQSFRYILSFALGENGFSESSLNLELIKTAELLLKMLEACHLIYVRAQLGKPHFEPEK